MRQWLCLHLFGIRTFVWYTYICLVYVHLFGIRTFVWYAYIWLVCVHLIGMRTFDWYAYIWLVCVHLFGIRTFVWYAYIWLVCVHLFGMRTFVWYVYICLVCVHLFGMCTFFTSCSPYMYGRSYSVSGTLLGAVVLQQLFHLAVYVFLKPLRRYFQSMFPPPEICPYSRLAAGQLNFTLTAQF
jgi:hypothetical protein